jgi:hypothetical protein
MKTTGSHLAAYKASHLRNWLSDFRHHESLNSIYNSIELYRLGDRRLSPKFSANVCGYVPRDQRDGSLMPYSQISRPEPLLFLPSSSSVVLTRLSGLRSRSTTSHKIW